MSIAPDMRERAVERLSDYLSRNGLKQTRQREAILEVFLCSEGHTTSEQLYERVRGDNPEVGAATVYRTLKLFCDAGIAHAHHFREGVTLYEPEGQHHDHLICLGCGEIVEFECELIEIEQEKVAREYGYRLTQHRHTLYGYCGSCQGKGS